VRGCPCARASSRLGCRAVIWRGFASAEGSARSLRSVVGTLKIPSFLQNRLPRELQYEPRRHGCFRRDNAKLEEDRQAGIVSSLVLEPDVLKVGGTRSMKVSPSGSPSGWMHLPTDTPYRRALKFGAITIRPDPSPQCSGRTRQASTITVKGAWSGLRQHRRLRQIVGTAE
jgi:hypothetical protein